MVIGALESLDSSFLGRAQCYFGGGTRIVLALGEYRESADIDFLCASRDGYRALRATVSDRSLGGIGHVKLKLAREVIADRYGIRTVLDSGGGKLKFEIILEGRIELSGGNVDGLPVPALDAKSCCAEKFLANADRWGDESALGRDVVDLAFMAGGAANRCARAWQSPRRPMAKWWLPTRSAQRRRCWSARTGDGAASPRSVSPTPARCFPACGRLQPVAGKAPNGVRLDFRSLKNRV